MTSVAAPRTVAGAVSGGWRRRLGHVPTHVVVILLMFIWLIPTIGLFINSFRPSQAVQSSGWWTAIFQPSQATMQNYAYVLAQSGIWSGFINSLFITIPATIIPIFVAAFAAYAFAWMSFPGRNLLFVAIVGLLVVPLQTTFIPILQLYASIRFDLGPIRSPTASTASSWPSGWRTRATACRLPCTYCATTWADYRARSSSRPPSTEPVRSPRSSGWRSP